MAAYNDSYSLPRQPVPPYPISILEVLFPGFTNISAAFHQLQTGDANGYARILCICGIVVFLGKYAYTYLEAFIEIYFISNTDEAYDMLVAWISSQPFAQNASSAIASVGARKRRVADGHSDGSQKKFLQYSPSGTFFFWYKKHLLSFRGVQRGDRFFPKEEISVSCIGRSSNILRDLLSKCRTQYLALVKNKTSIFKHRDGNWNKTRAVDIRQPDTVIVNEEEKTALLEDNKCFLASQAWYSVQGIPHRKGYLLYGPGGTGKSSMSLLIAGECDLDIYTLNLSTVDDDSLDELFNKLPARCVIFIKDIDAVNSTHSRHRRIVTPGQHDTTSYAKEEPEGRVSLSTFLNVIDGVGSQEGRVLIVTTNHVERLDAALLRPGRVDIKLELGLTTRDVNARLFFSIFRSKEGADKTEKHPKLKKLEVEEETELKELAADFASKVPEDEFSPAEIQLFLVGYRKSPTMAVQNVQEWVVKCREEKRHIGRADPWVSEERFRSDNDITAFATTQDDAQAREMASIVTSMTTPLTTTDSHCCSQVPEDYWGNELPFRPLDYTYPHCSQTSPNAFSNGTPFESGSEISYGVDMKLADVTQEPDLETCRQPATPPPSPITSIPVLRSGNQEKEMSCRT